MRIRGWLRRDMESESKEYTRGVAFGVAAFTFWGLTPLYFKLLEGVDVREIVAHRVGWTVVILLVVVSVTGRWESFRGILRTPRRLGWLCLSAALIGCNWLVFAWAVLNDRVLETSLGYFINPLLSVLLGVVFLRERLRPLQQVSVLLAGGAIAYLLVEHGRLPWVALALAFCFGFYGLIRKQVDVDPFGGLLTETGLLFPAAAAYFVYLYSKGQNHFGTQDLALSGVLLLAGPLTIFPLTSFAFAARRIRLTTIGFLQYIAPSITFVIAVFWFREPFGTTQLITFSFIWLSLILFTVDGVRFARAAALREASPAEVEAK